MLRGAKLVELLLMLLHRQLSQTKRREKRSGKKTARRGIDRLLFDEKASVSVLANVNVVAAVVFSQFSEKQQQHFLVPLFSETSSPLQLFSSHRFLSPLFSLLSLPPSFFSVLSYPRTAISTSYSARSCVRHHHHYSTSHRE